MRRVVSHSSQIYTILRELEIHLRNLNLMHIYCILRKPTKICSVISILLAIRIALSSRRAPRIQQITGTTKPFRLLSRRALGWYHSDAVVVNR